MNTARQKTVCLEIGSFTHTSYILYAAYDATYTCICFADHITYITLTHAYLWFSRCSPLPFRAALVPEEP